MATNNKQEIVKNYIEEIFFCADPDQRQWAVPRADLNLLLMRKHAIGTQLINSVLETYVKAGLLELTEMKIERTEKERTELDDA